MSRATVSRVINGSPVVSQHIRASVEEAIARLGYVPNRAARSLVMRRTDSVVLVMREPDATVLADPYLANIVIATSQALVGTGVQLVLMNAQNDAEHARLEALGLGFVVPEDERLLPGRCDPHGRAGPAEA